MLMCHWWGARKSKARLLVTLAPIARRHLAVVNIHAGGYERYQIVVLLRLVAGRLEVLA
jgi:hypothetical protein